MGRGSRGDDGSHVGDVATYVGGGKRPAVGVEHAQNAAGLGIARGMSSSRIIKIFIGRIEIAACHFSRQSFS